MSKYFFLCHYFCQRISFEVDFFKFVFDLKEHNIIYEKWYWVNPNQADGFWSFLDSWGAIFYKFF